MCIVLYFVAPVCFNTTYCGREPVSNSSLSFVQCCFELSGTSYASPGQCMLCPKGTYNTINIVSIVLLLLFWVHSLGKIFGWKFSCENSLQ